MGGKPAGMRLAPFMRAAHHSETYGRFEEVILVRTVREVDELAYHASC